MDISKCTWYGYNLKLEHVCSKPQMYEVNFECYLYSLKRKVLI